MFRDNARITGGTPAGMPDYKPWRPSDKPPPPRFEQGPLCQVYVQTRKGKLLAIGPKCPKSMAQMFCDAVTKEIAKGTERLWSNPHVIQLL